MTETHKMRIGQANKRGRFENCLVCKNKFWLQPHREKTKYPQKYCSRDCFKIQYKKEHSGEGENNKFWRGGSFSYRKRFVLKRDNWTCAVCGLKDLEIMEVDHIIEKFYGGTDDFENLQTLCPNCHARKTNRFLRTRFGK